MSVYSSINHAEQIHKAIDDIRALRQLKKDVDPASGMSVSLRRGVSHDNPDVDDDNVNRPWETMEICEHMEEIIDILIAERIKSLRRWVKSGGEYSTKLAKSCEAAYVLLKDGE